MEIAPGFGALVARVDLEPDLHQASRALGSLPSKPRPVYRDLYMMIYHDLPEKIMLVLATLNYKRALYYVLYNINYIYISTYTLLVYTNRSRYKYSILLSMIRVDTR